MMQFVLHPHQNPVVPNSWEFMVAQVQQLRLCVQYEIQSAPVYKACFVCVAELTANSQTVKIMVWACFGEFMAQQEKLVSCFEVWHFNVNTEGPAFWIWDGTRVF